MKCCGLPAGIEDAPGAAALATPTSAQTDPTATIDAPTSLFIPGNVHIKTIHEYTILENNFIILEYFQRIQTYKQTLLFYLQLMNRYIRILTLLQNYNCLYASFIFRGHEKAPNR